MLVFVSSRLKTRPFRELDMTQLLLTIRLSKTSAEMNPSNGTQKSIRLRWTVDGLEHDECLPDSIQFHSTSGETSSSSSLKEGGKEGIKLTR